jgi:ribosome-associated toxin RatA of RatAB toxin-antitoxin module
MPHASVTEFVRAEPGAVYELFLDAERFPEFMSNVESVAVVERGEGWSVSHWHTDLDGAPLEWRERDRFDDERRMVQFRLIEGDIARFEGYWQFAPSGEGTRATCELDYELGVPVIEEIVGPTIHEKIVQNIQEMLRAVKERLEVVGASAR